MGPVRRTISLVCALGLFGGGCYMLLTIVQTVMDNGGFRGRLVIIAVFMIVVGGYWLREDFIKAAPNE